MARKEKKYHFIYKTTNQINGKFYVGMHSTDDPNDGYLGSGYKLRRSINKYGNENFKMEILEFFDNRKLLVERERDLVNEELLKDPMCMNLVFGGNGGFISVDGYKKGAKRMNEVLWSNPDWVAKKRKLSKEYATNNPTGFAATRIGGGMYWAGKTHTEETKRKMSEAKKGKYNGFNNPQFGTMWITNGTENKKIKKEEKIPTGWNGGRVIKK